MNGRRRFLKQASLAALAGLTLPTTFLRPARRHVGGRLVRVRGAVRAGGRGLANVRVTDGQRVVQTDADGGFALISDAGQRFVYLSVPAGYGIPKNPTGTARCYQPLAPDGAGEMEAVFDLVPLAASDDAHTFFVLADTQMQDERDVARYHDEFVPDLLETVRAGAGRPMFGVACGDIMWDNLEFFPEYERGIAQAGIPFFQVVGNHDIDFAARSDEHTTAVFERHFGPTYYSFDRGAVHYVVLDDVLWHGSGYIGYLDERQLAWLEQDLAFVEAGRPVVVFVHIPALSSSHRRRGQARPDPAASITNRAVLYEMLAPYRAHVVSGHTHEKEHVFEGGVHEHVSGAVCGAWWTGGICRDGTPNGYDVCEVRGEALTWRYKATGHDAGHQMRLYAHGRDPEAPDEIVANVWDWEPSWTVAWYEDGVRAGQMARRTGTDPRAVRLYDGPALPPRRTWVDAVRTDHLFYAPAARQSAAIVVEAVDGAGRTYTETLEPSS